MSIFFDFISNNIDKNPSCLHRTNDIDININRLRAVVKHIDYVGENETRNIIPYSYKTSSINYINNKCNIHNPIEHHELLLAKNISSIILGPRFLKKYDKCCIKELYELKNKNGYSFDVKFTNLVNFYPMDKIRKKNTSRFVNF